jgi:hypothetical protein
MPDEPLALSKIPAVLPAEADFDEIHTAVTSTGRGRWFLEEYARRNRNADTERLLAAIARIEAVIHADHIQRASQSERVEPLEMTRAIAETYAEVDTAPDVVGVAERLRVGTAALRARSIEPSTCEQIDALAASILSASSLRDPADHRAQKLRELLQYLEHRIERLLDGAPTEAPEQSAAEGHQPEDDIVLVVERTEIELEPLVVVAAGAGTPPAETVPPREAGADFEHSASRSNEATDSRLPAGRVAEEAPADFLLQPTAETPGRRPDVPFALPKPSPVEDELFVDDDEPFEEPAPAPATTSEAAGPPPRPTSAAASQTSDATPTPSHAAGDPLAALKAMTDEERIALFT